MVASNYKSSLLECSPTPDGNPDVMEAKWTNMVNHVQDIHDHDSPLFPSCAHPELEGEARDKEWLQPGELTHHQRVMFSNDGNHLTMHLVYGRYYCICRRTEENLNK